jgi:hypothetical protein
MIARNPSVRRREGREQSIEHIAGTVEDEQQTREEDPRVDPALAGAGVQPAVEAGERLRSKPSPKCRFFMSRKLCSICMR